MLSKKTASRLWITGLVLVGIIVILVLLIRVLNYYPAPVEAANVLCNKDTPLLEAGKEIKVMSWNVQYLAGKGYVFYYDLPGNTGPDSRPSAESLSKTLSEVVRIIGDEKPDILLLQEVDDGAKRSDYHNQTQLLQDALSQPFPCLAETFYWKSLFVPHPKIMGSTGLKLVTLSKYRIEEASRLQLPLADRDFISSQFYIKHAILDTTLSSVDNTASLHILNTHLDAFSAGTDTMQHQVEFVKDHLATLDRQNQPWILGGDFNLLAGKISYDHLPALQQNYFNPNTELSLLTSGYDSVPSVAEIEGPDASRWITHYPNDPSVQAPDRTIDYIFFSKGIVPGDHFVRQKDTISISDHFPLVTYFYLP